MLGEASHQGFAVAFVSEFINLEITENRFKKANIPLGNKKNLARQQRSWMGASENKKKFLVGLAKGSSAPTWLQLVLS